MSVKREEIKAILTAGQAGTKVTVKGWVRNHRSNKQVDFIVINDGSSLNDLQAVADPTKFDDQLLRQITPGSAVRVTGTLAKSEGAGQNLELQAEEIELYGGCDGDVYPMQPKKHSLEFLREQAHLRFRTKTFSAITRVRHQMIMAVHAFFNEQGFFNIHTPIITASDCEGAGAMFQVTTLDINKLPRTEEGEIDYKQDFFGKMANLTVSGQLNVETACMAMSKVYTFGPTFRAENSNTSRHLAEFWMIEPEVAFNTITENMDLAEAFLRHLIKWSLDTCMDELLFLEQRLLEEEKQKPANERSPMNLIEKLNFVLNNDFIRLSYTDAIEILKKCDHNQKGKFAYKVENWGIDLQSEHERYLVEKHFKKPVILINYPKEIKSFYMKQNPDGKTVAAMDILFPQIGEIIGGSEREADYDKLKARIEELHIPDKDMWWYLDTRRFGACPHAGFGLGFERLMLFVTGMTNIRDVIAFPRAPKTCDF